MHFRAVLLPILGLIFIVPGSIGQQQSQTAAEAPPILPDPSIRTDANGNPEAKPAGPAAQPIAGHFIMWLFDDVHLSFGDLAQTREAAKRVLKDSFAPGTRASIYTTSGHTSLDFTDDRDKLD